MKWMNDGEKWFKQWMRMGYSCRYVSSLLSIQLLFGLFNWMHLILILSGSETERDERIEKEMDALPSFRNKYIPSI